MIKFEKGSTYETKSVCDHNCKWIYTVSKRTAKTVVLTNSKGEEVSCRIKEYEGEELVKPLGSYSMAPVLRASNKV